MEEETMLKLKHTFDGSSVFLANLSRSLVPTLRSIRAVLSSTGALYDCLGKRYVPLTELDFDSAENVDESTLPSMPYPPALDATDPVGNDWMPGAVPTEYMGCKK